jgi:cytochrome c peroxidase
VEFYDKGGFEHDAERVLHPLGLTQKEKSDLVAFLKSLTTAEDKAKHSPYR